MKDPALPTLSNCHNAQISSSRADGVTVGYCTVCDEPVVRINPRTGVEEWLEGASPWSADSLRPVEPRYGPRDNDLGYQEASLLFYPEIVERGAQIFIKWTCPKCGERVISDDPMRIAQTGQLEWRPGYQHTEREDGSPCGETVSVYTYRFGCMLMYSTLNPPTDWAAVAKGN